MWNDLRKKYIFSFMSKIAGKRPTGKPKDIHGNLKFKSILNKHFDNWIKLALDLAP
jgi:hypothetical protein